MNSHRWLRAAINVNRNAFDSVLVMAKELLLRCDRRLSQRWAQTSVVDSQSQWSKDRVIINILTIESNVSVDRI